MLEFLFIVFAGAVGMAAVECAVNWLFGIGNTSGKDA